MRRFVVLPFAALLALAAAAPVLAGPNVRNQSGGGNVIAGSWSGENLWGYVELFQEKGAQGEGFLYEEFGTYVECDGTGEGSTSGEISIAAAPGEGSYGFQGTRVNGWAYGVVVTLSSRLASGAASGTFELWIETVDECAGIYDGSLVVEPFSASVTGVGAVVSFRGFGSYQVPSEFNGHGSYRGKERQATGSLELEPLANPVFDWAYMSQYTWIEHVNE